MLPPNQGAPGQPMGGPPMTGPTPPPSGPPMEGGQGGEPTREEVVMELKKAVSQIRTIAGQYGITMEELMSEGGAPTKAPPSQPMPPPPMG